MSIVNHSQPEIRMGEAGNRRTDEGMNDNKTNKSTVWIILSALNEIIISQPCLMTYFRGVDNEVMCRLALLR